MSEPRPAVVVAGGGITGLVAALTLRRALGEGRVVLLEATDRLGGKIVTEDLAGGIFEGGPDWFLTAGSAVFDLCRDLGLADALVEPSALGAAIWSHGRLRPLPPGFPRGIPVSPWAAWRSGHLSPGGAARALADLVLPGPLTGPDISVGDLVRRRFGRQTLDRLVDPMLAASRAGDAAEISLAAGAPEVDAAARSHRSVIGGLRRAARGAGAASGPAFAGLAGGMSRIVGALESALDGVEVRPSTALTSVSVGADGLSLETGTGDLRADATVLALPTFAAADVLRRSAPEAAAELDGIEYASAAVVGLVYPPGATAPPGPMSGFLVPRSEGRWLTAAAWFSHKWPHTRPPSGAVIVRCFVGRGPNDPALELDDDALARRCAADFAAATGVSADPLAHRVVRWDRALPIYLVGHHDRVRRIERHLDLLPGVALAGAGFRGSGLPDCIAGGSAAAMAVLEHLRALAGR